MAPDFQHTPVPLSTSKSSPGNTDSTGEASFRVRITGVPELIQNHLRSYGRGTFKTAGTLPCASASTAGAATTATVGRISATGTQESFGIKHDFYLLLLFIEMILALHLRPRRRSIHSRKRRRWRWQNHHYPYPKMPSDRTCTSPPSIVR